jgi:hypothetical protein
MSSPVMPRPGSRPRKPLLGLRRKPGRLALAMFRMPLRAYRHDRLGLGADVARLGSLVPPRWGIGLYRPLSGRAGAWSGFHATTRRLAPIIAIIAAATGANLGIGPWSRPRRDDRP